MARTINAGKIQYQFGFKIDEAGITQLKNQLNQLSNISATQIQKINPNLSMNEAMSTMMRLRDAVKEVQTAMNTSFNSNTGIMNLERFKNSLQNLNLQEIRQRFNAVGEQGRQAFLNISKAALTTTVQLKQTNSIFDKMGQTLMNTLKWQISSSAINRFTGAIQQAYGYVQHLDSSLNDIRIVTDKSADEMERFARSANKAAKELGASTTDYTEAALIYYQQGLSDEDAQARAETTLKAANVTGQSGQAVSEQLTAVWNGYKVTAEETELAVDKLAAVAATTASDLEELSTGMSKVASAASNMGVDMDQLNAQIATIISVTRQAPESVGTALKTIYARMADLKLGETDEDGLKLGDVSGSLEKVGISVLDTNGDLREMGDVIEEVAAKWDTWTKAQQAAIAQSLAGKRQYNNLVALFDNWDMYTSALETSQNAMGTLQHQQDIYMESTEAHLQVLKTQWEDLYDSILDTDTINTVIDGFTKFIKVITTAVDSMGGLKGVITGLSGLFMTVFSKQVAQSFAPLIQNIQATKKNALILKDLLLNIEKQQSQNIIGGAAAHKMAELQEETSKYWKLMSAEQFNANQESIREIGTWEDKKEAIKETEQSLRDYLSTSTKINQTSGQNQNLFTPQSTANKNTLDFLQDQQLKIKNIKKEYDSLNSVIQKVNQKYITNSKITQTDLNKLQGNLVGLKRNIQSLADQNLIDPSNAQKAFNTIDQIQKRIDKIKKDPGSVNTGFTTSLIESFKELNGIINLSDTQIKQWIDALENGEITVQDFNQKIASLEKGLVSEEQKIELTIQSISKLTGGISSAIFAFNSFSNIIENISNKDLSFAEKIQQGITSLAMSIPMAINGIRNIKSGLEGLGVAANTAKIAMMSITGVIAALSIGLSIGQAITQSYVNKLKTKAESDKRAAEAAKEHTEAIKEQGQHLDEIISKYNELNEQIKNQETTTEGARDEIYNLCKQYGFQDLALKALITDYEKLSDVLDEANEKRRQEELDAARTEKDTSKRSLASNIWANLDTSQRDENEIINGRTVKQTIDLSDMGDFERNVTSARSNFADQLQNLGLEIGDWGHISLNDLLDVYAKNKDALLNLIENSNVDAASELREIINANIEQFEEYRKFYQDEKNQTAIDKIQTSFKENVDSIESVQDFNRTVDTIIKSLTTVDENGVKIFDSEAEAEEFVKNYLSSIEEIKEYAKESDISSALISGGSKFSESEIVKQIEKRSSTAIQFLSDNVIAANAYDNLDDFFDEWEERIKYENTKNNRLTVNVALKNAADGKEFDEDTLNKLFDNTDLADVLGISKEDFADESSKRQKQILIDYYLTAVQEEKHYQEIKKEGLNEEEKTRKNNLEKGLHELQVLEGKYAEQNVGFTLMSADHAPKPFVDKIQKEFEYLKAATIIDVPVDITFDTEEGIKKYKEFLNKVKEENPGIGFDIDSMLGDADKLENINEAQKEYQALLEQYPDLYKEGQNSINDLEDELAKLNLKEAEAKSIFEKIDYLPALNAAKIAVKDLNSEVDNLQSIYQTLQNVVKDYNEDQMLTLDNLQALMEMDSLYVATLELENGQLVLNENTYKTIMDAKLQEMRISAAEQFLIELGVISTDAATKANLRMADASRQNAEAIQGVIDKCREGVQAVTSYAMSLAGVTADEEAVKVSAQAFYNRIQFVDEFANQPISSMLGKSSSSSSSSSQEPEQVEYLEREVDLYREVNEELDDIESKLGRVEKVESHSWGVSYLDTLQKQNELLDKQLEKLQKKKSIQEGDLATRRKQLEDLGVNFSADGAVMTNAEAVIDNYYANYNAMVDKYNAMSVDEQESYKSTLEAEEDNVKKIEDAVNDYESLYSDYQSILDEIQENYFKQIEKEVDEFNFEVDLHLELSDARKEWKDFWHDVIQDIESDDFGGQIAKSLSTLGTLIGTAGNNAASDVSVLTNHLNDTINEVTTQIGSHGLEGLFGTDTALSKENLENYRDQLMEALKSAKEEIENISDNYLKMLDSAKDLIKEQVDDWNTIGDQIAHNIELIKLLDGDTAYNPLNTQYEQQYQNNLNLLQVQKIAQDNFANDIKHYKELMDSVEQGSQQWKTYEEAYNKSVANYKEAVKDLDSTVEKSIKDIQTWRENNVNSIIDTLDKAMSGGLGTDLLEKEWKLINDYADKYYDNVERAYNMEDYTNLLNDAANAIGLTAANQAKLNAFRDKELKQLNEKEKLTQYDIDESKARLEILKQEIALQDAQRNKSNMRLRRDNQGNYVYQYTGDEEAIDQAENGVLTAKKAWYDLVKKRYKETSEYIMQLEKENVDFHKQLADAMAAGDEVRANKLREMIERNNQQINFAYEQAEKNKRDLFNGTAQYFANVENANILPQSEATVRTLVDQWAGSGKDSFITAIKTAFTDLESTQEEYNIKTQQVLQTAGVYYERLRDNGIDPVKDSLEDLIDTNEDFGNQLDDINDKLREEEDVLRGVENAYNSLKDSAVSAIQEANSALETLARTHMQMQDYTNNIPAAGGVNSLFSSGGGSRRSGGDDGGGYNPSLGGGDQSQGRKPYLFISNCSPTQEFPQYTVLSPDGTVVTGPHKITGEGTFGLLKAQAQSGSFANYDKAIGRIRASDGNWYYIDKLKGKRVQKDYQNPNVWSFKSGGYTGDWSGPGIDGIGGRAAILHQKELVLNEQDTSNMLKAVSALRGLSLSNIANSILTATQISAGLISQISGLGLSSIAGSTSTTENYRNMTVNADFSGVRSADQIYQAIMELENYGLQNSYSSSPLANRSH